MGHIKAVDVFTGFAASCALASVLFVILAAWNIDLRFLYQAVGAAGLSALFTLLYRRERKKES